jgi:hypothetical protein
VPADHSSLAALDPAHDDLDLGVLGRDVKHRLLEVRAGG